MQDKITPPNRMGKDGVGRTDTFDLVEVEDGEFDYLKLYNSNFHSRSLDSLNDVGPTKEELKYFSEHPFFIFEKTDTGLREVDYDSFYLNQKAAEEFYKGKAGKKLEYESENPCN